MPSHTTEAIRNVALVGHAAAGKTTLIDALLHRAGAIGAVGRVEAGSTVCDFDPQEKRYHHSLASALASLDYEGAHINLIDTPGYAGFVGHTLSVLPAVETVALVVHAGHGVEMLSRQLMAAAESMHLCRMVVVNQIDAENADLEAVLAEIQEAFGKQCLPLNLPASNGAGVVDCFFEPQGTPRFSSVERAHEALVDQIVELDAALMEQYLEQGAVTPMQLHDPFEAALRAGHVIPVCFVSAHTGAGLTELLHILAALAPNPREGNPHWLIEGEGEAALPRELAPSADDAALGQVFKVINDPFVGTLGVFRVHQGRVDKDTKLLVDDARRPFKVGHLFHIQGKEHLELEEAVPGDLCAVAKVDGMHYGAVLHADPEDGDLHPEPVPLPTPMYALALKAQRRNDEQKLADGLRKLTAEDPCLKVEFRPNTGETVLCGLGELHLRVALERLKERFHVEVETSAPKIAYRETVSISAEGHCRHKKQTGGAGQFAEVRLRVEPLERGAGFEFKSAVVGGAIPSQYIPAVEKGVRQILAEGAVAGYPVEDVRVTVLDGKHHSVDSKEVAFVTAGRKAFLDAMERAQPLLLEPLVRADVRVPDHLVGDLTGCFAAKRAQIMGTSVLPDHRASIQVEVPLAEMLNFQTELKSMAGEEGHFEMDFSRYAPVPADLQRRLIQRD